MKIEWIGHACFRLTAQDGTVVITDPYDESVGIDMIPLKADLITMSHEHHDHNETCMIEGNPVIVRGPQLAGVGSYLKFPTYAKSTRTTDEMTTEFFQNISSEHQTQLYEVYKLDFLMFNYSVPSYLKLE